LTGVHANIHFHAASGETRRGGTQGGSNGQANASAIVQPNASRIVQANASAIVEPLSSPIQSTPNPSLVTLVCRRLFGDARTSLSDDDRHDLIQLWAETAGQSVDLETELRSWLLHNTATDLRNPAAALLGWLRTAAKRAGQSAPGCTKCLGGWTPDEFGQPSEHRCTACRPHLRAVDAS
jgi:hypothetical protein